MRSTRFEGGGDAVPVDGAGILDLYDEGGGAAPVVEVGSSSPVAGVRASEEEAGRQPFHLLPGRLDPPRRQDASLDAVEAAQLGQGLPNTGSDGRRVPHQRGRH